MATGNVEIIKENLAQGGLTSIEQTTLFIGLGATGAEFEKVHRIGQQTDLDAILGADESALKTQIKAAALNAGANFTAYAVALTTAANEEDVVMDWSDAIEFALDKPNDIYPEKIAICDPITTAQSVDAIHSAQRAAENTYAKYIAVFVAVPGISNSQSWSEYLTATKALGNGKACDSVSLVPQIHGNNLGVVCGRLDNDAYSLADSPMRVASGPLVGLGDAPVDKASQPLTMAHLKELSESRFSVPQWYTNFAGIYWADHPTLDAEGGDFQVYENLRVWQYTTRRLRALMIQKIADRSLNQGAASTNYHKGFFLQVLQDASKGSIINGLPRPGLVQKPTSDDCELVWKSREEVELQFLIAPIGSPKKITARIALDLRRVMAE